MYFYHVVRDPKILSTLGYWKEIWLKNANNNAQLNKFSELNIALVEFLWAVVKDQSS